MWASVATGVLTIAGTLLGVWITRRGNERDLMIRLAHETHRANEELLRQRVEEACVLLDKWLNLLSTRSISLCMVMQGKLHYDQHNEIAATDTGSQDVDFSRMEMIIDFYLPHVRSSFDEMLDARTKLNEIERKHKRNYEQGNIPGDEFVKPYVAAMEKVEARGKTLRAEIVKWHNKTLQPTGFAGG